MPSTTALHGRLKELSATQEQIEQLVTRLHNFTTSIGQGNGARLELGAEIHSRLKDAEQELDLLRAEIEPLETGVDNRRKASTTHSEKEAERERIVATAGRLGEDLKRLSISSAMRTDFRNAQLHAKRNAELAQRKEKDLLLSRSSSSEKKHGGKLTHDDIVLNASNDVTAALRRTHQLMQSELSRSQFAKETLEQSTAAISSLSESYSSLDTLLSSSRNLASSLLRSQKSDTWYLETAFYILVGTISWLFFRRILYGPFWWLVWLPFKTVLWIVFSISSAYGKPSTDVQPPSYSSSSGFTSVIQDTATTAMVGTAASASTPWQHQPSAPIESDRLIDQIADMVEGSNQKGANIEDVTPEERARQEELPRNPKKRMFEVDVQEPVRDEL